MFKDTLTSVRRFLARRRGDCIGAMLSGYAFISLAPGTESPEAFRWLGVPLLIVGAALTTIVVAFPLERKTSP